MYRYREMWRSLVRGDDPVTFAAIVLLWTTAAVILVSVIMKFVEYRANRPEAVPVVRKSHAVETFSMTVVVMLIVNILQLKAGQMPADTGTRALALFFGGILTITGTVLHLWSKIAIGTYWSNRIEVRRNHRLITDGPYAIVRHPMYSSMILWLVGCCVAFLNPLAAVLVLLFFVPMMIWRANAEDRMLKEADKTSFAVHSRAAAQLVPRFSAKMSVLLRVSVIGMLGYSVALQQMNAPRVLLLALAHFLTGLILKTPKVRFSFINKSIFILAIGGAMQLCRPASWLLAMILFFDIWGLFGNCPCMFVYEKYNGCPCFDYLKACFGRKNR